MKFIIDVAAQASISRLHNSQHNNHHKHKINDRCCQAKTSFLQNHKFSGNEEK